MSQFDSIVLNGQALRPAPFVSTSFEYAKFNNRIIGGMLVVTLSGTLVDENILQRISELNALQGNSDCIELTIGCADSGGRDFLDGSGRIRSVDISQDSQPFIATYTIVIGIETIDGQPAVNPEDEIALDLAVPLTSIPKFLQEYSETININGNADIICSHDPGMASSKSYLKVSGTITLKVFNNYICNYPSYDPALTVDNYLKLRSAALISGLGNNNPLAEYIQWIKWLDTKSLDVETNGSVVWQFDVYMHPFNRYSPSASVEINTTDRFDQKTQRRTRNISGSIKGISLATIGDHLGHKANTNERIGNAQTVFSQLDSAYLNKGTWPGNHAVLQDTQCQAPSSTVVCSTVPSPSCYQRVSHSITKSPIDGSISFDMEFIDIDACKSQDFTLDTTIDDTYPANITTEIIIPNRQIKSGQLYPRSIIQIIGSSSQSVTITIRATLNGCDYTKVPYMIECVRNKLNEIVFGQYPSSNGWFYKNQTENIGTFSYTVTHERTKCDIII